MKTRVGLIFGGRSGEHEISIRSAGTVIEQIDNEKFAVVPILITNAGDWLSPGESLGYFDEAVQLMFRERFGETPELDGNGEGVSLASRLLSSDLIDVAFPVLHGTYGEDGTIQGLFEMAGIPYVGCGVLASSCGMDKVVMKTLFVDAGLPICKHTWFLRGDFESNPDAVIAGVEKAVGYPCFVKPANLGSSVGVSKANDPMSLAMAIEIAAEYDRKIIVEEGLEMREIECAVTGNDAPEASRPGEYIIRDSANAFLDYTEKYSGTGNNEFVVPAPLSVELEDRIKAMALTAFKAIDGSGLARVDFFLRNDTGALLVNEINTIPGLTDASGFPKMWAGSGRPFAEILEKLVELAFERHADKSKNKTSK